MAKKKETIKEKKIVTFYKKNYKKFLILPFILLIFGISMIVHTVKVDGAIVYRDISLKGGLSAMVEVDSTMTDAQVQESLETEFPDNDFAVSTLEANNEPIGYVIETDLEEDLLIPYLEELFETDLIPGENYNSNYISPSLSNAFFKQSMIVMGISFLLMSTVIFLYFRQIVPSSAVILSGIFDIIVTIGVLNLMQFKVSIAGIGALLMIIGYSIDTDVLLTNRLIKEKGTNYFNKTFLAFKTGSLMSFTTLMAGTAALLLTNSDIIFEIALILVIGLLVDFISTWVQNASILLWWLEKKRNLTFPFTTN